MLGPMGEETDNTRVDDLDDDLDADLDDEEHQEEPRRRNVPRSESATSTTDSTSSSGSGVRWVAALALLVALGSLGLSLWMFLRPNATATGSTAPTTTSAPSPTAEVPPPPAPNEIADAKGKACAAYNQVAGAVTLRSNADFGPDPAGLQAEVGRANIRQAFTVGYSYLLSHLDPATPPPLADAIRAFSSNLEDLAINSLAGVNNDDPAQMARLQTVTDLNGQITELCK